MNGHIDCCREQDVLDALASARWPMRCDDGLRTHVAACPVCSDVVAVAGPLLALQDEAWSSVRVPSPGTVWWRAQLRARREAARQAARPIGVAQAAAGACAVLLTLGACWAASAWISLAAQWLAAWASSSAVLLSVDLPAIGLPDLTIPARWWWAAALAALWLIVGPLAFYLALADNDR